MIPVPGKLYRVYSDPYQGCELYSYPGALNWIKTIPSQSIVMALKVIYDISGKWNWVLVLSEGEIGTIHIYHSPVSPDVPKWKELEMTFEKNVLYNTELPPWKPGSLLISRPESVVYYHNIFSKPDMPGQFKHIGTLSKHNTFIFLEAKILDLQYECEKWVRVLVGEIVGWIYVQGEFSTEFMEVAENDSSTNEK